MIVEQVFIELRGRLLDGHKETLAESHAELDRCAALNAEIKADIESLTKRIDEVLK